MLAQHKKQVLLPAKDNHDLPFSYRIADQVTSTMGTITFLSAQLLVFALWIAWNSYVLLHPAQFDPYPYILLNLFVGIESACAIPLVMISQNKQETKDRIIAAYTFEDAELVRAQLSDLISYAQDIQKRFETTYGATPQLLSIPLQLERLDQRLDLLETVHVDLLSFKRQFEVMSRDFLAHTHGKGL